MEELVTYRAELLVALERVVGELSAVNAHQTAESWHQPIQTGPDSPHYILFHLRELEKQVFTLQLPRILAEQSPILLVFDDQAWMNQHYHKDEPASSILDELALLRRQELAWLRDLSPEGWSRQARHAWWGVHTLQWWVELQLEWSYQHLRRMNQSA